MTNSIKTKREALKLTQKQVAERANITEAQFQRYEYGKNVPTVTLALRIASALNTTVEDLYKNT